MSNLQIKKGHDTAFPWVVWDADTGEEVAKFVERHQAERYAVARRTRPPVTQALSEAELLKATLVWLRELPRGDGGQLDTLIKTIEARFP